MGSPPVTSTVHFPSTGSSNVFKVENVGGSAGGSVSILVVGFGTGSGYGITGNGCTGTSLAPGQSCTFTVTRGTSGSPTDAVAAFVSAGNLMSWSLASP